jgi:hypothetical protein
MHSRGRTPISTHDQGKKRSGLRGRTRQAARLRPTPPVGEGLGSNALAPRHVDHTNTRNQRLRHDPGIQIPGPHSPACWSLHHLKARCLAITSLHKTSQSFLHVSSPRFLKRGRVQRPRKAGIKRGSLQRIPSTSRAREQDERAHYRFRGHRSSGAAAEVGQAAVRISSYGVQDRF